MFSGIDCISWYLFEFVDGRRFCVELVFAVNERVVVLHGDEEMSGVEAFGSIVFFSSEHKVEWFNNVSVQVENHGDDIDIFQDLSVRRKVMLSCLYEVSNLFVLELSETVLALETHVVDKHGINTDGAHDTDFDCESDEVFTKGWKGGVVLFGLELLDVFVVEIEESWVHAWVQLHFCCEESTDRIGNGHVVENLAVDDFLKFGKGMLFVWLKSDKGKWLEVCKVIRKSENIK